MENRTSFIYNGQDSRDFYMYIENNVSFPSPEADIEFVEVAGRDGELVIDNERLKGVDFSLPVIIRPPIGVRIADLASQITSWLKADFGWHELILGTGSEYEYVALPQHSFDIQRTIMNYGRTVLHFRLKPYKYVRNRQEIIANTVAGEVFTIYNPEVIPSEPRITVYGTGDIDLINDNYGYWFRLKGLDNQITIDSEMKTAYKYRTPQYGMFNPVRGFPLISPGVNEIKWEGTGRLNFMKIEPNWRAFI